MEKQITMHPRRLARQIARAELNKAGVTGYNKERRGPDGRKVGSVFSFKWREIAAKAASQPVKPHKKKNHNRKG